MYDIIIEILGKIAPAIITGIFTFLITKYNYNRNIPLDKYEITYNRIYYPIYCLIQSDMDVSKIIDKCEHYLEKYKKYVDRSTMVAFKHFKNNFISDLKYNKKAYNNFKNNIYAMDSKLRRKLGYLEPSFFNMYTYSDPFEKRILRSSMEIVVFYLLLISSQYVPKFIQNSVIVISTIVLCIFIIDFFWIVIQGIIKGVKKVIVRFTP